MFFFKTLVQCPQVVAYESNLCVYDHLRWFLKNLIILMTKQEKEDKDDFHVAFGDFKHCLDLETEYFTKGCPDTILQSNCNLPTDIYKDAVRKSRLKIMQPSEKNNALLLNSRRIFHLATRGKRT